MALTKVSTDGVKDDAITKTKIPANQIEASELADNAVDTNAIADQAVALSKLPHGTSSNDGKFLRANNGADPTFETVTGTTINNNANNRVITGSGTANSLEAEPNLTFDNTNYKLSLGSGGVIQSTSSGGNLAIGGGNTNPGGQILFSGGNADSNIVFKAQSGTATPAERMRLTSGGDLLVNTTSLSLSKTPKFEVKSDSNVPSDFAGMFTANNATAAIGISFNSIDCFDNGNTATLFVKTNGTERLTISPTGNVGIGTTSPSTTLSVINNSNFEGFNVKHSNLTQGVGIGYDHIKSTGSSANVPLYIRSKGTGRVSLGYDSTNKVQVDADGLKFNADTAAANALDDYEEGTWTPQIQGTSGAGTASYNTQRGRYLKVGNLVYLTGYCGWTSGSAGGELRVTDLPFSALSNSEGIGSCMLHSISFQSGSSPVVLYLGGGTNYTYFYQSRDNNSWISLNYDNAGYIIFNVTYRVA